MRYDLSVRFVSPGVHAIDVAFVEDGFEVFKGSVQVLTSTADEAEKYGHEHYVPEIKKNVKELRTANIENLWTPPAPVVEDVPLMVPEGVDGEPGPEAIGEETTAEPSYEDAAEPTVDETGSGA